MVLVLQAVVLMCGITSDHSTWHRKHPQVRKKAEILTTYPVIGANISQDRFERHHKQT
jgi:hypothetical protein